MTKFRVIPINRVTYSALVRAILDKTASETIIGSKLPVCIWIEIETKYFFFQREKLYTLQLGIVKMCKGSFQL